MDENIRDNSAAENLLDDSKIGTVKIANDVVATIVGLAATEVEGIAGMSGGIAGGIAEMLGRKNLTKGVKIDAGETDVTVDIFVIMDFGVTLPAVAQAAQENVKKAIETMTGLNVASVNVHIQGVIFPPGHPAVTKQEV